MSQVQVLEGVPYSQHLLERTLTDNESNGSYYGAGRFNIHRKACKYMYSVLNDNGTWTDWESTTTVRIKKLHVGIGGWPSMWADWETTMQAGGTVTSAVDGFQRRFCLNKEPTK